MNEPLISVIIPAYNVAPYIRQAVGAVVYVDSEGRETCRSVSQAVWTTEEMIANMYTRYVEFVTNGGKLFHQSLFDQLRFPQGRRFEDAFLLPKLYARAEQIAVVASQSGLLLLQPKRGQYRNRDD